MEIIFFTLYNRNFHPFGRIIVSDDNSGDMEQVKSSFWTDKIAYLRKWNNIKNMVHMTADSPRKFYNQCEKISKTQNDPGGKVPHNTTEQQLLVNQNIDQVTDEIGESDDGYELVSISEPHLVEDKDSKNESEIIAQSIISNCIESSHLTEQEDEMKKQWIIVTILVAVILLLGLFTGMAIVFGFGLNVQIGKSSFYLIYMIVSQWEIG